MQSVNAQKGSASYFGWTGRYFDDTTDLYNNLHRWRPAGDNQWLSEDPIGFGAGDANTRRYAGNDPVNNIDPNGLDHGTINDGKALWHVRNPAQDVNPSQRERLGPVYMIGEQMADGRIWLATGAADGWRKAAVSQAAFEYAAGMSNLWSKGPQGRTDAWNAMIGMAVQYDNVVAYNEITQERIDSRNGNFLVHGLQLPMEYRRCAICHGSIDGRFDLKDIASGIVSPTDLGALQFMITQDSAPLHYQRVPSLITDKYLPNVYAVAAIPAGLVPGVGEALDLAILLTPGVPWEVKAAAGISLGVNALTVGFAPNFGGLSLGARESSKSSLGWSRRIAMSVDDVEFQSYSNRDLFTQPGTAHHLNQPEIFAGLVRYEDGITTPTPGNAFSNIDSPHFLVHRAMEAFFDNYRTATGPRAKYPVAEGTLFGEFPRFREHNRALYNSLQYEGNSAEVALRKVIEAKREQLKNGFRGNDLLDVPKRMGQKGGH